MNGLNLLSSIEPADSGLVVTARPRGTTGGRMWQLALRGTRRGEERVESTSEEVLADTHLVSYALDSLAPGVYRVESASSGLVFFRVTSGREMELLKNERAAWRELQR